MIIDVWSEAEVSAMKANVCAVADGEGLCYNLDETLSGNTFDAHRLLLWAQTIRSYRSSIFRRRYEIWNFRSPTT